MIIIISIIFRIMFLSERFVFLDSPGQDKIS